MTKKEAEKSAIKHMNNLASLAGRCDIFKNRKEREEYFQKLVKRNMALP